MERGAVALERSLYEVVSDRVLRVRRFAATEALWGACNKYSRRSVAALCDPAAARLSRVPQTANAPNGP